MFTERHLRRVLIIAEYYYHTRTHLSVGKDRPDARPLHPPEREKVIAIARIGGSHHRYECFAEQLLGSSSKLIAIRGPAMPGCVP